MAKTIGIMGAGVTGMLASLVLSKSVSAVYVFAPKSIENPAEYPYVCPSRVVDILKQLAPDFLNDLIGRGARLISNAEILKTRFGNKVILEESDRDQLFLCCSSDLFRKTLSDHVQRCKSIVHINESVQKIDDKINILTANNRYPVDLILDCAGKNTPRRKWLDDEPVESGGNYICVNQFFESKGHQTITFNLMSGNHFRGGIYPLENNKFAFSFVIPESAFKTSSDYIHTLIKEIPGAPVLMHESRPVSEVHVIKNIKNYKFNYYSGSGINGLYPVGEAALFANPIYGRGIALSLIPLQALVSAIDSNQDISTVMRNSFFQSLKLWKICEFYDLADGTQKSFMAFLSQSMRNYQKLILNSLMFQDPSYYRNFLNLYQLKRSAFAVAAVRHHFKGFMNYFRSLLVQSK